MLKAPPQRFRPRLVTAAPSYKATELGNPVHRLDQRGGLLWWSRALMDGTIQSLPFVEVQQDATGHVGHRPRQHCGIKNPPGNDTIQRQAALQALATCELACFNPTPAFHNPVPDFNGMITNDKCCCTRWGQLQLSWWRRPLRLRQEADHERIR